MSVSQADGGTRSGLLWEVERILNECNEIHSLPQILLMENVPEVVGTKNIRDFKKWEAKLRELGYQNYVEILNAKDYGIPQNRRRCFMISILGDYSYNFPCKIKLKHRLRDILEDNVDEKYYLSDAFLDYASGTKYNNPKCDRSKKFISNLKNVNIENICGTITTREGNRSWDNFVVEKVGHIEKGTGEHQSNKIYGANGLSPTLAASDYKEPVKILIDEISTLKKELCNELVKSGMVDEYDIVKHSYTSKIMNGEKKAIEKSDEMITLTTRGDCFGVTVRNKGLRIRKLTPKECMRLMSFSDKDADALKGIGLTDANVYHCAGDSIAVVCLISIFSQLFDNNKHMDIIERYLKDAFVL